MGAAVTNPQLITLYALALFSGYLLGTVLADLFYPRKP